MPRQNSRLFRAIVPAAMIAVCAVTTGCVSHSEPGSSRLPQAQSWSDRVGGPANRSQAHANLSHDAELQWARPLGAPLVGTASSPALDWSYQATISERGCNFFAVSDADGRKNWCTRLATAGPHITATVDGRGTVFLPQFAGVVSTTADRNVRWYTHLGGTPTSVVMFDNQHLLVIDHFGVAHVLNTHVGNEIAAELRLAGPVADVPADYGLSWCAIGARGCPAPGPAAVDTESKTAYLTVWTPGDDQPDLVAVRFTAGDLPTLSELWRVPLADGRAGTPVVLSNDRERIYLHSDDGSLDAFTTSDGAQLWSQSIDYIPDFSPAVSPDGTLVTGGRSTTVWRGKGDKHLDDAGPAPVVAVASSEGEPSIRWRREDLQQLANPVATPNGQVVIAVRAPNNGIAIEVLDSADGSTVRTIEVPHAQGPVSGLSVDAEGNLMVSTSVGTVYLYR